MSNTLKFGNGQWATKKGSTLAYNDENGNFKPLPFNFERSTSATRVNKEGLIEVVSNNEPRIDFSNDSKGALLLEPQRTNIITYSEDFSNAYWTKTGSSVVSGFVSPKGDLSAFKLVEDTSTGVHATTRADFGPGLDLAKYTLSVYAKKGENDLLVLQDGTTGSNAYFNLTNGVVDGVTGTGTAEIKPLANDFYHCSFTFTQSGVNLRPQIALSDTTLNGSFPSYTGDGISGIYIYGAQLEQGSYATSYIPTQGSAVTRVAESCEQTPPSGIIGQTEGVFYVEAKDIADDGSTKMITLNDGGQTNEIRIDFRTSNSIQLVFTVGGSPQAVISTSSYNSLEFNKIAFKYKENDFALWVNGVKVGVDTNGSTNATNVFSVLEFKRGSGLFPFYGSTKNVKFYNTALTDQELQALTS